MTAMLFTLGVILLAVAIDNSEACSCGSAHPQTQFCNADFVMQVRLRGEGEIIYQKEEITSLDDVTKENKTVVLRYPHHKEYNVVIRKMFKVNENSLGLTMNSTVTKLFTAAEDSLCGVDLQRRTNYLVTGSFGEDHLSINLCGWVQPWPWVSKTQRKNLRFLYKPNCDCKPYNQYQYHGDEGLNMDKTCKWDVYSRSKTADCYKRHSACVFDKNSSTGGCKWHRNRHLKKCRAEAKSRRWEP